LPLIDWFLVGTSHPKLDLEDLLDRYDPDPRELNVSPFELLSDTEIDLDARVGCADCGEGKPLKDIGCTVEGKAFASFSGMTLRGWLKLSDLAGSGGVCATWAGDDDGRGFAGCVCAGWKWSRSESLGSCETVGRSASGRKTTEEEGSSASGSAS
jgi:hypothetical protein